MRRLGLIAVSTFALSCAAAGDEPANPDSGAPPDSSRAADPDARSPADAAPRADATPMPDAAPMPDAMPTVFEGALWALERFNGVEAGGIGGRMVVAPFWGPDAGSFEDCTVYSNVHLTGGSAGNIAVTGVKHPVTLIPLGEMAPFIEYSASAPADLFDPGDVVTFTATGGPEVGPFTGSVVAPQKLSNVEIPTEVSLATQWTVTWDAGDGDFVFVWLDTGSAPGLLFCTVPDTGSYSIPVDALALIPAGNHAAVFRLYRMNQTDVMAGPSVVHLWASDSWETNSTLPIVP